MVLCKYFFSCDRTNWLMRFGYLSGRSGPLFNQLREWSINDLPSFFFLYSLYHNKHFPLVSIDLLFYCQVTVFVVSLLFKDTNCFLCILECVGRSSSRGTSLPPAPHMVPLVHLKAVQCAGQASTSTYDGGCHYAPQSGCWLVPTGLHGFPLVLSINSNVLSNLFYLPKFITSSMPSTRSTVQFTGPYFFKICLHPIGVLSFFYILGQS